MNGQEIPQSIWDIPPDDTEEEGELEQNDVNDTATPEDDEVEGSEQQDDSGDLETEEANEGGQE